MSKPYRFQFLPGTPLEACHVAMLPIAHEATVCGRKGTASGPEAIFQISGDLEYYEEEAGWSPFQHLRLHVAEELRQKKKEDPEGFHDRIAKTAKSVLEPSTGADDGENLTRTKLLIALGGEHSITPSVITGAMPKRGTVVVFDAHADLRTTYQGSIYSHACAVHRLRELGHRVVLIGLRSMAEFEAERIRSDKHILTILGREANDPVTRASLMSALHRLKGDVWVSCDMDAFDPSLVPSVGTPQPDGLDWAFVSRALEAVMTAPEAHVRGADVVEVIPEKSHVSQLVAAKLIQRIVSLWGKARGFDKQPLEGSQAGLRIE
ncbi:MAG: arginase family protein [Pseudomonadota bacterium]